MSRNNLILLMVLATLLTACGKEPQAGGEQATSPIAFSALSAEAENPATTDFDWYEGPSYSTDGTVSKAAGEISFSDRCSRVQPEILPSAATKI